MGGRRYFIAVTVTAAVGVFLWGVAARAAVNYFGQGNVSFDSITVGKAGVGGVTYFNGTMVNQTSSGGVDNPITIGDGVRIDGSLWRGPGAGRNANIHPLLIDDNLEVRGDIKWDDGSSLSNIWDTQIGINSDRYGNIANIVNFLECVGNYASSTTYVWSSDYIFCYNLYIAGNVFPSGQPAVGASDEGIPLEGTLDVLHQSGERTVPKL